MVKIKGLTKAFRRRRRERRSSRRQGIGGTEKVFYAIKDVTFGVRKKTILGLLGPNGAGKTTLLRVLSTSLKPTRGTAAFGGIDIVEHPLDVRRKIGFLSDNTGLYGRLTAREMITYFGRLYSLKRKVLKARLTELIELLNMADFIDKRTDALSSGMKQKVSIARTLIHNPDIIIFDEPTTGLDVEAAESILRFIESCKVKGKTVLFCTHHMHEVERLCDEVVILHQAALCFQGTLEQMRRRTGQKYLDKAFLTLIGSENAYAP